jgi:CheY-like chemotaxis protein
MPGLSGIDLAKSIRTLGTPDIKIFLMTAFDAKIWKRSLITPSKNRQAASKTYSFL